VLASAAALCIMNLAHRRNSAVGVLLPPRVLAAHRLLLLPRALAAHRLLLEPVPVPPARCTEAAGWQRPGRRYGASACASCAAYAAPPPQRPALFPVGLLPAGRPGSSVCICCAVWLLPAHPLLARPGHPAVPGESSMGVGPLHLGPLHLGLQVRHPGWVSGCP
jgi:hypothetical protein